MLSRIGAGRRAPHNTRRLAAGLAFFGAIAVIPIVAAPLVAGPADLDPTFDGDGIVTTRMRGHDAITGLVQQASGKLVAVGPAFVASNDDTGARFTVVRYNVDGSLDTTFGGGGTGIVHTQVGAGSKSSAHDIAIQPDDRLVVAGIANGSSLLGGDIGLARYLPGGSLDTSFGAAGTGIVVTDVGAPAFVEAVLVQADGKIVVAGVVVPDPLKREILIARYLNSGVLDTSFGGTGIVTTAIEPAAGVADIAEVAPGKVVVVGSDTTDFLAVQYDAAGALDASFGAGGIVKIDIVFGEGFWAVDVQPDGKIVAGGAMRDGAGGADMAVMRLLADGTLDPAFATGGLFTFEATPAEFALDVLVQADGRIVVAGIGDDGDRDLRLLRLLPTGALDPAFGTGGAVLTDAGSTLENALVLIEQSDGKLVVGGDGDFSIADPTTKFLLARYGTKAGPPTLDFGDAPDSYTTSLASGGPRHPGTGPLLGAVRDLESDAALPLDGSGDDASAVDDEDGVVLPAMLVPGGGAEIEVTVSAAGLLDGFVDFDGSGTFDVPAEQVFTSVPLAAGSNVLPIVVPATAVAGATFARFRVSSAGGLKPSGPAADGEVEDYRLTVASSPSGGGGVGGPGGGGGGGIVNRDPRFDRDPCDLVVAFPLWTSTTVSVAASDPDGDEVSVRIQGLPWWMRAESTSGRPAVVRLTATPTIIDWLIAMLFGSPDVMITATDGRSPPGTATCHVRPRMPLFG